MRIVHAGGSRLGERVLEILRDIEGDRVTSITTLAGLRATLDDGRSDWLVSSGFRYIMPSELLGRVGHSCNVHTSLLPWGRGANPNVWAIAHDEPAGVTIHEMSANVDAGDIWAQREVNTTFADVASDLYLRLEDAAVELFAETWPRLRNDEIVPIAQPAGGSFHRQADFRTLCTIDLDRTISWRTALNTLRALTFPPYANAVVQDGGRHYHVEIAVSEITPEERGS